MLNYNKYRHTNKRKLITPIKLTIFKLSRFISSHLSITSILIAIFILSAYTTGLVYNHYKNNTNKYNINNTNTKSVILDTYGKQIEITTTTPILPHKTIEVSRGNSRVKNVNTSIVEPVVSGRVDKVIEDKKVDVIEKDFAFVDSFVADVTAYTLFPSECGNKFPGQKGYGITASGKYVVEGTTIATSSKYKFGTKIRLEGFKSTFVVQDRGGDIKGDRIDVFMNNRSQAFKFGRKKLKAYIVEYAK